MKDDDYKVGDRVRVYDDEGLLPWICVITRVRIPSVRYDIANENDLEAELKHVDVVDIKRVVEFKNRFTRD